MDDVINKSLVLLGLSKNEVKIYLTIFKLGPSKIPEIAKASKIKRSTTYLLVEDLIEKGFLFEDNKAYANKIYAIEPDLLLKKISNRQRLLRRQEIELQENMPSLQSVFQSSEIRPKVKIYQGNNGLLSIWQDILSTKNEILLWTNQQTENLFFGQNSHDKFIKERIQKNISIKVLATKSKEAEELKSKDKDNLRETKILSKDVSFSSETYIYDNKVAMLDYNKEIMGIIIESKSFNETQQAIFENTWKLL